MRTKYIYTLIAALFLYLLGACTPSEYELEGVNITSAELVEGISFTITHDSENPNIIYLESKMDKKYTPLWIHPQGRSQEQKITLKIPFAGSYNVTFGVMTRGGAVYGQPASFEIDEMYAGFISDPMWSMIAGGAGNSKTWHLDLDADAVSRHFLGPIYFFTDTYTWDNLHTASGENYLDADVWDWKKAIKPLEGVEDGNPTGNAAWYWLADYPGNSWTMDAADFGTMTFDLKDGANVIVDQEDYGLGKHVGTYLIDTDNHTLLLSNVYPLHDKNRDSEIKSSTEYRILYLSENFMQILAVPMGVTYNYISQDFKDNWTPGEVKDPEPELPNNWENDISQTVSKTVLWKLSDKNPLDWCSLDGSRMNDWNNPGDYPDWLGTPNPGDYSDFSMKLNSEDMEAEFTWLDGSKTSMKYSLDEKGIYSFDGIVEEFSIIGWATFHADSENKLRIMSIEKDVSGNVSGMWLGAKDPNKPEYMAFHLIPSVGTSVVDPMTVWKRALVGKTFQPDVNYFADWVTSNWSGGWTSDIYPDDFASEGWFWSKETYDACKASEISFYLEGDVIMANSIDNGVEKNGIVVSIDIDENTITFSEAPFTFTWIYTNNNDGQGPWLFGSYDGASLSNIDSKGMYLGFVTNDNEITMNHLVLKK